jgi:ketosteroid isomerase-like protein
MDSLAMQITGDVAVDCYWMKYEWQDKDGKGTRQTIRVTYTCVKEAAEWKIVGGMSMAETANP